MHPAEWGPRPGGPPVPQPASEPKKRVGLILAGVIAPFAILFASIHATKNFGGLLLLVAIGCVGASAISYAAEVDRAAKARRRDQEELERWRQTRPEAVIARDRDPLQAARAMTLQYNGTNNGGVFLGITPDYREWRVADREHAVLVLGPPRSGKTSALIVPAILAASGPVVSTSTKLDVLQATAAARSTLGRIWLFDPSGTDPVPPGVLELHWSPVRSARTWDGARAIADAMVDASSAGHGVENATYWSESAKALLAPLLHAAALQGATVTNVRRWVSRMWLEDAGRILETAGADAAADDLSAIAGTEERERSSIFSTARIVLAAYGSDAAAARSQHQNFDADRFVRSQDTVYMTAPSHLQNTLAPLVVGLLEDIRNATYAYARERTHDQARAQADADDTAATGPERRQAELIRASHEPSSPAQSYPVLWALDEVANIAPLRKLPGIISEAGSQGLQVLACFQDLSQARQRWGAAADGFLTLFNAKVVFPGIGDKPTLDALSTLVGDWDRPYHVYTTTTGQSTQYGFPILVSAGTNTSVSSQYSTQREQLLTPSEIANIPDRHALTIRTHQWGVVETTRFFEAAPWPAVLEAAPTTVLSHGGPDDLPKLPVRGTCA